MTVSAVTLVTGPKAGQGLPAPGSHGTALAHSNSRLLTSLFRFQWLSSAVLWQLACTL